MGVFIQHFVGRVESCVTQQRVNDKRYARATTACDKQTGAQQHFNLQDHRQTGRKNRKRHDVLSVSLMAPRAKFLLSVRRQKKQ
ncbi:hypothetical protein INR49_006291 [Caranx melampygus]|nr:hypothetical protein INR49_006291 [Caranx melampygus]